MNDYYLIKPKTFTIDSKVNLLDLLTPKESFDLIQFSLKNNSSSESEVLITLLKGLFSTS